MTSAEIVQELRAARPPAPTRLHAHVAAIAASTPPARTSLAGRLLPRRRLLLVAVPTAALLAVASAGVIGVVDPARDDGSFATRDTTTELAQSATAKAGAEAAPAVGATAGGTTHSD